MQRDCEGGKKKFWGTYYQNCEDIQYNKRILKYIRSRKPAKEAAGALDEEGIKGVLRR